MIVSGPVIAVAGPGCVKVAHPTLQWIKCGNVTTAKTDVAVSMGGRSNTVEWRLPVTGQIVGGTGVDTFYPALAMSGSTARSEVKVVGSGVAGDTEVDSLPYSKTDSGITFSRDGIANDGRPGDTDNLEFNDVFVVGAAYADTFYGDAYGNQIIDARSGHDVFHLAGGVSPGSTPVTDMATDAVIVATCWTKGDEMVNYNLDFRVEDNPHRARST